ncbi:MAG: DnaA N-terminal domain-containing protein, partial [Actinomycetota bacterium]
MTPNRGANVGTPAADDLWVKVAAAVRAQLNEATWNTWFQGVHAAEVDDERLLLNAPSTVAADRISTSYAGLLTDA